MIFPIAEANGDMWMVLIEATVAEQTAPDWSFFQPILQEEG